MTRVIFVSHTHLYTKTYLLHKMRFNKIAMKMSFLQKLTSLPFTDLKIKLIFLMKKKELLKMFHNHFLKFNNQTKITKR